MEALYSNYLLLPVTFELTNIAVKREAMVHWQDFRGKDKFLNEYKNFVILK